MQYPGCSVVKNPAANVGASGDMGLIPGSGRSPGPFPFSHFQSFCIFHPEVSLLWTAFLWVLFFASIQLFFVFN